MKLTDAKIRTLAQQGKHFDGHGLYLELTAAGGRYWRLKYRHKGKEKRLALGVYPAVTLKEAREASAKARQQLQLGTDPGVQRKAAKVQMAQDAANTLQLIGAEWVTHQSARWAEVTKTRVLSSLEANVFPALGHRPLAGISPREVMEVVKAVEARGAGDQAGRILQRIRAIYRWALTHGRIDSNPMVDLVPSEILRPRQVSHRAALPEKDLQALLSAMDSYGGEATTVQALRMVLLTAARPGEVRGARWAEIDLSRALWVIPAERMKMRTEHRVPLSRQARELVEQMESISGASPSGLVFPSPSYQSKPISENTLNSALARMGFKDVATAHGFRALFSTVANERGWNPDVIERQLAHLERNRVRAAYHRSSYMEDRAKLLQWWADYLDRQRIGQDVGSGLQRS